MCVDSMAFSSRGYTVSLLCVLIFWAHLCICKYVSRFLLNFKNNDNIVLSIILEYKNYQGVLWNSFFKNTQNVSSYYFILWREAVQNKEHKWLIIIISFGAFLPKPCFKVGVRRYKLLAIFIRGLEFFLWGLRTKRNVISLALVYLRY